VTELKLFVLHPVLYTMRLLFGKWFLTTILHWNVLWKTKLNLSVPWQKKIHLHGQKYEAVCLCKLDGHEGSIFRIAWYSDGSKLISVSDDRSARIWAIHERKEFDDSLEIAGSHSVGPVLFGHMARVWDCCIFDDLIVTAGEDCTCRVWGLDGNQLVMIREHM